MAQVRAVSDPGRAQAWLTHCVRRGLAALTGTSAAAPETVAEEQARFFYLLHLALEMPDTWGDVRHALEIWLPRLRRAMDEPTWLQLLEALCDRAHAREDRAMEALVCLHLGTFYRVQGRYPRAEAAYRRALHLFGLLQDPLGQAQVQALRAYLAWQRRTFGRARRLIRQAEAHRRAVQEETPRSLDAQAYIHLVQGALAFDQQDWDTARMHMDRAHRLWRQIGELRMAGVALSNLALVLHWSEQDLDEAHRCYQEAIGLLDGLRARVDWATALMNFGLLLRRRGQVDQALTCYRRAERVFRQAQDRLRLARLYNNIGQAYQALGRWDEAEQAYRTSLEQWGQGPHRANRANTLINLVRALRAQGKEAEATALAPEVETLLQELEDDPAVDRLWSAWEEVRPR